MLTKTEQTFNSDAIQAILKRNNGKWINDYEFNGQDLSSIDFSNARFYNTRFENCRIDDSLLQNTKFHHCRFTNVEFHNVAFHTVRFVNTVLRKVAFHDSVFYNATFDNAGFIKSSFENSMFDTCIADRIMFDEQSAANAKASGALQRIKYDLWGRLLAQKNEVSALREALLHGQIKGSVYEGDCCCLVGTLARSSGCNYRALPNLQPDPGSAAERWFMGINEGDTPANSPIAKITMEWMEEFETNLT